MIVWLRAGRARRRAWAGAPEVEMGSVSDILLIMVERDWWLGEDWTDGWWS